MNTGSEAETKSIPISDLSDTSNRLHSFYCNICNRHFTVNHDNCKVISDESMGWFVDTISTICINCGKTVTICDIY